MIHLWALKNLKCCQGREPPYPTPHPTGISSSPSPTLADIKCQLYILWTIITVSSVCPMEFLHRPCIDKVLCVKSVKLLLQSFVLPFVMSFIRFLSLGKP